MEIGQINFNILNKPKTQNQTVNSLKTKVKTIYHISDIHIHLYKRHKEYKEQFQKLYDYLKNEKLKKELKEYENTDIEMIITITGDILHSKSDLSPECIDITYNFIKSLANIMPVIIIPGNHDLNMNNKNRLDSISPILADLQITHPVYYLQQSGVYLYSNLVFMHASIFDYQIIPINIIKKLLEWKITNGNGNDDIILTDKKKKSLKYIALYHGRVNGCELFNGTRLEGELSNNKKTITPNDFEGYDIGICGDIHLQQNITQSGNVAYAGSFIQQNLGERITGHGVLKWNVKTGTYKFNEIPNNYGYATLYLKNGKLLTQENEDNNIIENTIMKNKNYIIPNLEDLPKNLRLRILYENTNNTEIENFLQKLKETNTILEYNIQNSVSITMNSCGRYLEENTNEDDENNELSVEKKMLNKSVEFDIQDVEFQNSLLEEIILDNYDGIEEEDIKEIKELNLEINKIIKKELELSNKDYNNTGLAGNRYKLLRLEFSNLYSYGENNIINFKELNGIVGIVAPNHMGKSAIIDIILYALFDKFPRRGTIKDIINIRKNDYSLKLIIGCSHYEYIIEKSGKRSKSGGLNKATCNFYKRNTISGEISNLAQDSIKQTREFISRYFGHYEDIIDTNFSIQTAPTGFIDSDNASRRKELERIMRFDYVELIVKKANESIRDCRTIISHLQSTMPPEKIKELKENINKYKIQLEEYSELLETKQQMLDKYQEDINKLNQEINLEVDKQIEKCLETLEVEDLDNISTTLIDTRLQEIKVKLSNINVHLENELLNFKKLCKLGVIQRLDVPDKDLILDFCDNSKLDNILSYKKLIKSFIKEYKQWENDQHIEKQIKLQSINKQIRILEKNIKPYYNEMILKITSEDGITTEEIYQEFNLIQNDIKNNISKIEEELTIFVKIDKDINLYKKKISKIENKINDFNNEIIELLKLKMPIEIMNKIKEYQLKHTNNNSANTLNTHNSSNDTDITNLLNDTDITPNLFNDTDITPNSSNDTDITNSSNDTDITNLLNDILNNNDLTITEIRNCVSRILEVYKYEQECGFISWVQLYITEDEKIDSNIADIYNKIDKEKNKIEKNRFKIIELEIKLIGKYKIENNIQKMKSTLHQIENDIKTFNINLDILNNIQNYEKEKQQLETELSINNIDSSKYIDNLETLWINIKDEIISKKDLELEVSALDKLSSGLDELLKQVEKNTKLQEQVLKLTEIRNNELIEFNKLNTECQTIRDKCSLGKGQLEKMVEDCNIKMQKEHILELLNIYKKALAIIPMILINKIKPVLIRKVNDLLTVVTNFTLEFDFDDNKVDIFLKRPSYKDKHILINNSSGFERFISSLAIRLALMEISKLPSPNVMIIDEGWSCFDNENLHNLDVILDHLSQRFDFILTISHLQIIRQHCDIQIGLNKNSEGFSEVRFG
jgi:DNA repair exonuclease SbcCD ATPase subunit/predicted MPP superfamily phosphohydrolase